MLSRLDSPNTQPSDRMAINQYRAFCLLALGRMQEAERAIEAVLTVDLVIVPADAEMSPRLRSAFAGVRQRILPAIVQQEYARAKAAFDRRDFPSAIAQFDRVLQALCRSRFGSGRGMPPLADLRTLAAGFRDLSAKAAAPPPAPPAPARRWRLWPGRRPKGIYGGTRAWCLPPGRCRQSLPPFARELIARTPTASWNSSSTKSARSSRPS